MKRFSKFLTVGMGGFLMLMLVLLVFTGCGDNSKDTVNDGVEKKVQVEEKAPTENSGEPVSQEDATIMAKDYLEFMPFSRDGLIEQLEYEGVNTKDATQAVDQLNVDWREQAVGLAELFQEDSPSSREEMIELLEWEDFSNEDAIYAVDKIGL